MIHAYLIKKPNHIEDSGQALACYVMEHCVVDQAACLAIDLCTGDFQSECPAFDYCDPKDYD